MRDRAVDHAMVVAQRDVAHRGNGNGVVDHHRAFFNRAEAQDAYVGLTDYRKTKQSAEDSRVGDREGALLDLLGLELFAASALCKIIQVALNAENVLLVGILDYRD